MPLASESRTRVAKRRHGVATWHRAWRELGIKGLMFHAARHTVASKCLHAGATPQEVTAWLGDTLEVFYRHYAHIIEGLRHNRAGLLAGQSGAPPGAASADRRAVGALGTPFAPV